MIKLVLLAMGLLLTGCVTSPAVVGDWQADPLPAGMTDVNLHLSEDGSYAGKATFSQSGPKAIAGQWKGVSPNQATLTPADRAEPATVTVTGKDRMIFLAGSNSITFVRQ